MMKIVNEFAGWAEYIGGTQSSAPLLNYGRTAENFTWFIKIYDEMELEQHMFFYIACSKQFLDPLNCNDATDKGL